MTESAESSEAPNWLSELERKREIRLKARLGHEAGAGAPCIQCNDKCPGLDLHFWRKICKNCKCSKEDHDVHDDDIYGWAQFQLLGSKPHRTKKKIVLPGKKDAVELEWAPTGNNETIDQYLKTLAPETLPVKGSQAAQERKQLLQKQIPIHDIDPSLCHELTESELAKFQDYIKHMKDSAGVGQIIQFNVNYGATHNIGETNAKVVSERYPKNVTTAETVQLLGERKTSTLTKQLERLGIQDQKELDAFFDKIPKPHNMTAHNEKLGYGNQSENAGYPAGKRPEMGRTVGYNPTSSISRSENYAGQLGANKSGSLTGGGAYTAGHARIVNPPPLHGSEINKNDPTDYDPPPSLDDLPPPPSLENLPPPPSLDDLPPSPYYEINKNLATQFAREHLLNESGTTPFGYGAEPQYTNEINRNTSLPHYIPGSLHVHSEHMNPTPIGNVRDVVGAHDLTNSNYNQIGNVREPHDLANSQYNPTVGQIGNIREPRDLANSKFNPTVGQIGNVREPHDLANLQYNPTVGQIGNLREPHDLANSNLSNYKQLQALNPSQLSVSENQLMPNQVKIGAIRDITYENPEIKTATQAENALFEGGATVGQIPEDIDIETKQCRKCGKFFEQGEFAIFVDKSNALYHSNCFRCAGCNQNLADLFYFYDKETDDVYCGRDFAKIRGIPRCQACDELIFVKEYCLAENSTFHLKHFCCFECDQALAGQNYVVEESQPVCLPCFEKLKANKCISCRRVIAPDEQGVSLSEEIHFHAADECFCCSVCKKVLHGAKLLFRNNKLYCSHDCFKSDE